MTVFGRVGRGRRFVGKGCFRMVRRPPESRRKKKSAAAVPQQAARPAPDTLQVLHWPAPVLKQVARPVKEIDPWVQQVIDRMIALMTEHEGVGLAAPQVGLPLRLFIMSPTGKPEDARVIINPVITEQRGEEEKEEGCLSLPEIRAQITRAVQLKLTGLDQHGRPIAETLEGFPARIVQHENDHLDGILILDRMSTLARMGLRRKIKALEQAAKDAEGAA